MGSPAPESGSYDVKCPHCNRPFHARLLADGPPRYSGFKCPHCKLFVPFDRVGEPAPPAD